MSIKHSYRYSSIPSATNNNNWIDWRIYLYESICLQKINLWNIWNICMSMFALERPTAEMIMISQSITTLHIGSLTSQSLTNTDIMAGWHPTGPKGSYSLLFLLLPHAISALPAFYVAGNYSISTSRMSFAVFVSALLSVKVRFYPTPLMKAYRIQLTGGIGMFCDLYPVRIPSTGFIQSILIL